MARRSRLQVVPLSVDRWADLETLFGARGACGGCWCMWPRLPRAVFERQKGEPNREALRARVRQEPPPGLLAYIDGVPAAWCAVGPREEFVRLARSAASVPAPLAPVWSIVCLFVARPFRRQGLSAAMIEHATRFAKRHGARLVEGYPVEPRSGSLPDAFAWTGLPSAFARAGFEEAARRSPTRPIMRKTLR
jgi:GNAT superfamily N-acetyltransferase